MLKKEAVPGPPVARKEFSESKISAAIHAYNEEKTIGSVVLIARRYADQVIVVDDGSEDRTAWVAEQAGATVIQHQRNRGYGAALRSCFNHARTGGCGILVILDGDGQHQPEMIPQVIAPVSEGKADISIGSRFVGTSGPGTVPRYRKFGIRVITKLTNLGTHKNQNLRDAQSGFRAYSRAAVEAIDPREPSMGASTEILWEAEKHGLKVVEVPVEIENAIRRPAQGPLGHGLSVIGSMVRYVETEHALLFFSLPGVIAFATGLLLGFYVVDSFYRSSELAIGLALVTVLLLFAGMLLSFTGLILHAVITANRRTSR